MTGPQGSLENIPTLLHEKEIVERALADAARGRPRLRILEAGCGRKWVIDLKGVPHTLTGIDLDRRALTHRRDVVGDLHYAVLGDLRTGPFRPESFDAIYSAYVLEHIADAEAVLDRFASWLRQGGLLIVKIPARESVVGWLTRILPFWVHVAFYRYVAEDEDAGKPGHPPYPVIHDPIISLEGMRAFCRGRRLRVVREAGLDFGYHYRHLPLSWFQRFKLKAATSFLEAVGRLSFGRLTTRYSGLFFVIEKTDRDS